MRGWIWAVLLVCLSLVTGLPTETRESKSAHVVSGWRRTHHTHIQEHMVLIQKNNTEGEMMACPVGCEKHGTCNFTSGGCTCDKGFYGRNCTKEFTCMDDCNNHGFCVRDFVCECLPGFSGTFCDFDTRCPENCNGRGTCINAGTECDCNKGSTGPTCADRDYAQMYPPLKWQKLFPPIKRTSMGRKPVGRHSHGSAVYGGPGSQSILLYGGTSGTAPVNDMWVYDHLASSWREIVVSGEKPTPRSGFAVAGSSTAMYLFGGWRPCSEADSPYSDELWRFTFSEGEWIRLPLTLAPTVNTTLTGRVGHTLVYVAGNVVIFGGIGASGVALGDTWHYNTQTSSWSLGTPNVPLRMHAAVAIATTDEMLVFGGLGEDDVSSNKLWKYSTSVGEWGEVGFTGASSPPARYRHAMVWREGALYLFGGQQSDSCAYLKDTWQFILETNAWVQIEYTSSSIKGTIGMTANVLGNTVLFVGGLDDKDTNNVLQLDVADQSLSQKLVDGETPARRLLHSGEIVADKLWIFGGEDDSSFKLDDLWAFSFMSGEWTRHSPTLSVLADNSGESGVTYSCGAEGTGTIDIPWPTPRSGHASTVVRASIADNKTMCPDNQDAMVIFGGQGADDGQLFNDLWWFCPSTNQFNTLHNFTTPPSARDAASIAVDDGTMFVFGGMTAGRKRMNDIWACQLALGRCHEIFVGGNKHPHTRRSMRLHIDSHRALSEPLVFGGYWTEPHDCADCAGGFGVGHGQTDHLTDLWRFEKQYSRWRKVPVHNPPQARFNSGSVVRKTHMLMHGGFSKDGSTEFSDTWVFDLDYDQWHELKSESPFPPGRHDHTFTLRMVPRRQSFKTQAVVFGGIGGGGIYNDIWVADVTPILEYSQYVPDNVYGIPQPLETNRERHIAVVESEE